MEKKLKHEDYQRELERIIGQKMNLTILRNKRYGLYIPDLTVTIGPRKGDKIVIDIAMDTRGILHALGGFYIIKILGYQIRLFIILVPDEKYEEIFSPFKMKGEKIVRRSGYRYIKRFLSLVRKEKIVIENKLERFKMLE